MSDAPKLPRFANLARLRSVSQAYRDSVETASTRASARYWREAEEEWMARAAADDKARAERERRLHALRTAGSEINQPREVKGWIDIPGWPVRTPS